MLLKRPAKWRCRVGSGRQQKARDGLQDTLSVYLHQSRKYSVVSGGRFSVHHTCCYGSWMVLITGKSNHWLVGSSFFRASSNFLFLPKDFFFFFFLAIIGLPQAASGAVDPYWTREALWPWAGNVAMLGSTTLWWRENNQPHITGQFRRLVR